MKLGGIHNFSTTPGKTCAKGVPCFKEGRCYALKAYRIYPSVRKAWDENTKLLMEDKAYTEFVEDVSEHIQSNNLDYFRFSVAGDIFSTEYLEAIIKVAEACPDCKMWLYTKQYDVLYLTMLLRYIKNEVAEPDEHAPDLHNPPEGGSKMFAIPPNLAIIVSEWNDFAPWTERDITDEFGMALFWPKDKKYEELSLPMARHNFVCPGSCTDCKYCATMDKTQSVIFHEH